MKKISGQVRGWRLARKVNYTFAGLAKVINPSWRAPWAVPHPSMLRKTASWGFHTADAADPLGFVAMACDELLIHAHDPARGLGAALHPGPRARKLR